MAITTSALMIMGAIGVLALGGVLLGIDEETVDLLLAGVATFTWALFAFGSLDVYLDDAATTSGPLYPLVYLGVALAFVSVLALLDRLQNVIATRADATDAQAISLDR